MPVNFTTIQQNSFLKTSFNIYLMVLKWLRIGLTLSLQCKDEWSCLIRKRPAWHISVSVGFRMSLLPFTGKQLLQRCEVIRGDAFQLRHHILHPFSRIDIGLVAGGYEGVDHGSAICGIVIVAVAILRLCRADWDAQCFARSPPF